MLQLYTFWAEPKNYVDVTRCWYAEHLPFPLNFFLPGQMQRHQLAKLCLQRADQSLEVGEELEKEVSLQREAPPPPPPKRRVGGVAWGSRGRGQLQLPVSSLSCTGTPPSA